MCMFLKENKIIVFIYKRVMKYVVYIYIHLKKLRTTVAISSSDHLLGDP